MTSIFDHDPEEPTAFEAALRAANEAEPESPELTEARAFAATLFNTTTEENQ